MESENGFVRDMSTEYAQHPLARSVPLHDPALGVEVGERVQRALMTRDDWSAAIENYLDKTLAPWENQ